MTSPPPAPSRRRIATIGAVAGVLVVALVVGLRAASGPDGESGAPPVTSGPSDASPAPGPLAPLTGLPDPSGEVARRCAVSVKIGNTPEAHPQYGLESADVVYEEEVEGGITRLVAVFHSQGTDRAGSVRSVRPIDQSIVWPIGGIFAYSGGTPAEVATLARAPVTRFDETAAGAMMFRDPGRDAPHNLYADVDQMFGSCEDPPPAPLFTYRASDAPVAGETVSSVRVGFNSGYAVTWDWDPASATWTRSIFGKPDTGSTGEQQAVTNVVVMQVRYPASPTSPAAMETLDGRGSVWVLSAGKVVRGSWVRPDRARPAQLVDDQQQTIALTPGRTWVELLDRSDPVTTSP